MNKTYVIAEAGVNHNGDYEIARRMIIEAKKAGADAIKFQTFKAESLVSSSASKAEYQVKNTGVTESQQDMLKRLELSYEQFKNLSQYALDLEIDFLSTPFDEESIEFLRSFKMPFFKVPSGEITNLPYLHKIEETKIPIIISTGMSTLSEIEEALQVFDMYDKKKIILLHCNTQYPTPFHDVNLRAMDTLKQQFGVEVGYSDHTLGIEVPIAAVALGAVIIEKHFTLDRKMEGPDHKASLEPKELEDMINAIRNIEKALGTGEKLPSVSELRNRDIARKSIVAKTDIIKGDIYTEYNITAKRPGDGISPMKWNQVIGRTADRDFKKDEKIEMSLWRK
jgi:N,N'-diacetyllegionaminate synthase